MLVKWHITGKEAVADIKKKTLSRFLNNEDNGGPIEPILPVLFCKQDQSGASWPSSLSSICLLMISNRIELW